MVEELTGGRRRVDVRLGGQDEVEHATEISDKVLDHARELYVRSEFREVVSKLFKDYVSRWNEMYNDFNPSSIHPDHWRKAADRKALVKKRFETALDHTDGWLARVKVLPDGSPIKQRLLDAADAEENALKKDASDHITHKYVEPWERLMRLLGNSETEPSKHDLQEAWHSPLAPRTRRLAMALMAVADYRSPAMSMQNQANAYHLALEHYAQLTGHPELAGQLGSREGPANAVHPAELLGWFMALEEKLHGKHAETKRYSLFSGSAVPPRGEDEPPAARRPAPRPPTAPRPVRPRSGSSEAFRPR